MSWCRKFDTVIFFFFCRLTNPVYSLQTVEWKLDETLEISMENNFAKFIPNQSPSKLYPFAFQYIYVTFLSF